MRLVSLHSGLVFALCFSSTAFAQSVGDVLSTDQDQAAAQPRQQTEEDLRLHLKYGTFDPTLGTPMVPSQLLASAGCNLYIVQFPYAFTDADRNAIEAAGGKLHTPLPHHAVIVRMTPAQATAVQNIDGVRWVGAYHPAYRLEPELITEHAAGLNVPVRQYNLVMADKRNDKLALQRRLEAIGGKVTHRHDGGLLMTAELTGAQLLEVAQFDEVLWIDRWSAPEEDMNNARTVQGTAWLESNYGYTGTGIRGHVYEGVEATHQDFTPALVNVRSGGQAQSHGHCTAGIIFGEGISHANARGHARGALGYYTNYSTVTAGWSRNQVIGDVVNVHNCMFTTASWGGARTTAYTSISADADDIVFDRRIPWTQSQSNAGTTMSRPEAWAKNVISIGGMYHYNDANPGNDAWGSGGSTGPAADGRIKPDLCNFYDSVWTSDRTGSAGYASTNYYTGFNGTSAATPITAGLNAIAIQIWTNHVLGNTPRVTSGTRFQNRPHAQMLKALQIVCASMYPFGTGTGQTTRYRGGWGYANVRTMRENAGNFYFVNEDQPIQQGQTHTHQIDVAASEPALKICMTYLDPQGNVASSIDRINNLNLRVTHPNGSTYYWGNRGLTTSNTSTSGGSANTVDTVECVMLNNPAAGTWTIEVSAPTIAQDGYTATSATDAIYALAVLGGTEAESCAKYTVDNDASTGTVNTIPFGTSGTGDGTLATTFANNNSGSSGGAVYFDVTAANHVYVQSIGVNTSTALGTPITADIYYHYLGTYAGNETNASYWTPWTTAKGVAAGVGVASELMFNRALYVGTNSGTVAIAIVARDFGHSYTNGLNTYSDSNVTIDAGSSSNVPFTGSIFSPRTANIEFNYKVDSSSWHNQIMQTVMRSADLGSAGNITGLAFAPSTDGRHYNRQLRIRMAHKPSGYNLSTTFATNITSATTVLNENYYSWHTRADAWNEVGLNTPFAYNGTSDVVVEIYARGNLQLEGTKGGFRRGTEPRLYAYGFPWSSTPSTGTVGNAAPKMRAEFSCAETGEFATSCGPARADGYSTPVAGTSYYFDIHDAAPGGAILIMGLSRTQQDLTSFGFTNCTLWNSNDAAIFKTVGASGLAFHNVSPPSGSTFNGLKIYASWASLDSTQPGGLTFTNQVRMIIGEEAPTANPNN